MLAKVGSAQAKIDSTNRSAPASPDGTTRAMYLSGTNAPSRIVSSERVACMPRTSQVGRMRKPSLSRGRNACTIFGFACSEAGPDRGQAAKDLVAVEAIAALDGLCAGG